MIIMEIYICVEWNIEKDFSHSRIRLHNMYEEDFTHNCFREMKSDFHTSISLKEILIEVFGHLFCNKYRNIEIYTII